jgi:hypothetical protein
VTFVIESDDVEDLELPCTLDVLNPWNKHLTTLTLFSDERNEELLNEKNKVRNTMIIVSKRHPREPARRLASPENWYN